MTGFTMLAVAVGWDVYSRTGNVFNLALIGLSMFIPGLLLFLLAGIAADRYDRRRIIAICTATLACTALAIGGFFAASVVSIWPVLLCLMAAGSAQAFLQPALQAILPNLVPRPAFARAVAGVTSVTKLGQLGGPALSGLLIAVDSTLVYVVIAALFALGAAASFTISADLRIRSTEPLSVNLLLGGFRHIRRTPVVLGAMTIDLIAVLFGGVTGLLPVLAIDVLHIGPAALGVLSASPAAAALLVGLILSQRTLRWPIGRVFFAALVLFGGSVMVIGLSQNYWLTLAAMASYGAGDMLSVYVRQSLVQLNTPDYLRGRVSAVNSVTISASNQLGDFRAGSTAALIGAPAAICVGAVMVLGATALWWRIVPGLRDLKTL